MRNEKPTTPDSFADMFFPERGVHDGISMNDMPPGFTPDGENVRVYEALTGRGRGGSRAGLGKFIPEQHSGEYEIQHLTSIVTVSTAMLGWSFNGEDQSFPGTYGGIGFLEQIDGGNFGFPGMGGGGYQPNLLAESRLVTMGAKNPVTGVVVISTGTRRTVEWPAGSDPVTVWAINQDGRSGDYLAFEDLTLHTNPPGAVGDGVVATTQFSLTDPPAGVHGVAEFSVFSLVPRTVDYYATNNAIAGESFTSRVPIRIRFTPAKLTMITSAETAFTG